MTGKPEGLYPWRPSNHWKSGLPDDYLLVMTTCADAGQARRLAERLVGERTAACVSIVPAIESVYRWSGNIEHGQEALLLIKTARGRYDAVEETIRATSEYDVPEVLAVPIATGSAAYLGWLGEAVATLHGKDK